MQQLLTLPGDDQVDLDGTGNWSAKASGPAGEDGRELELQNSGTSIDWRYAGDAGWTLLVTLAAITGPQGEPGEQGPEEIPGDPGPPVRRAN